MDTETLRQILRLGTRAPSGFNRQPWCVRLSPPGLVVEEHRSGARIYFDREGQYSAIDLGGFAHHLQLGAHAVGAGCDIGPIEEREGVLRFPVELQDRSSPHPSHLVGLGPDVIESRATVRTPFTPWVVGGDLIHQLRDFAERYDTSCHAVTSRNQIRTIAGMLAHFEALTLRCPFIREQVLSGISDGPREPTGIPPSHLGLALPLRYGFRIARRWPHAQFLWDRMAQVFRVLSLHRVRSAALLLALRPEQPNSPLAAFETGRALSQIWLRTTRDGLGLCPISSFGYVLYCPTDCHGRRCRGDLDSDWWQGHLPFRPLMVLRIGKNVRPVRPSPRLEPSEIVCSND